MFCKHTYTVLDKTTIPSLMDNAKEIGYSVNRGERRDCIRQYVTVVTCQKCGKLKKFTTETY